VNEGVNAGVDTVEGGALSCSPTFPASDLDTAMIELLPLIRAVPDFPHQGVVFRDITPLLQEPAALRRVIDTFAEMYRNRGIRTVVGIESRGFIFAVPLALALGCGFAPVRKLGKLPRRTTSREYALEYGTNHLEMHVDAVEPGQRVVIVDDVLATGGTAQAAAELVDELGGSVVALAFLIEIEKLRGREALGGREVRSLIRY
jgi:adenine phosphoribosyltransferase